MNGINPVFKWAAIILVSLAAIFGIYKMLTYRRVESIHVEKRYWSYWSAVKWDEHYMVPVAHTTCTGTGKTRTCTTSTTLESRTSTHTRCENSQTGTVLPARRPQLCEMRSGDYISDWVTYSIEYVNRDTEKHAKKYFSLNQWDNLPPGENREITVNFFETVVNVK